MQRFVIIALWAPALAASFVKYSQESKKQTLLRHDGSASRKPEEVPKRGNETVSRSTFYGVSQQIGTHLGGRQWWGFPHYDSDSRVARRDWEEFALAHGHYGQPCTWETKTERCSDAFICKAGTCLECQVNRDCSEHSKCVHSTTSNRMMCIPRDLAAQWNWREVVATVLIVITAMLSAAAGMGGGGVYVPVLLLLLGLSTKEAVPLSQAMIVGGAVVNVLMFCGDRHPKYTHRPKIDYDVIMMMNPGLAAGVTIGVICHLISPQWIIVFTLIVTLVITLQKSLFKGIQAWNKESAALAAQASSGSSGGGGSGGENIQLKFTDLKTFRLFAMDNTKPMMLIGGCWAAFFLLNLVKAPQCSNPYWFQLLGMIFLCFAFTLGGCYVLQSRDLENESSEGLLKWTPTTMWQYPLFAVVAGFLGGFLGIGGGIIMGPLLLELGMIAEANQATTAMFVFLSSSLATIQFVVLGKTMPQFVFWFTTWVVLSTFIGQTLIDFLLRKYKRSSVIVLSIAGIVAGSLVMMSFIGLAEVYSDIQRGANMGFKPHNLCMG
jgi:uncharacterized membrane protein YfcA